jgi:hypothetical protein
MYLCSLIYTMIVLQGNVSLGRICKFLQSDDLDPDNVTHTEIAGNYQNIHTVQYALLYLNYFSIL